MTNRHITAPTYGAARVTDTVAELGESPLWGAAVGLRWLDVPARQLHILDHDGRETMIELSETVTAVELSTGSRLLAVTSTGFGWLQPDTGAVVPIATTVTGGPASMNDGGIDSRGRCWAGSAVRDDNRRGVLYRLDGTTVSAHLRNLGMSNGIDVSPTGDVLYHVDSAAGAVTAWEYDVETGELGDSRLLRSVPAEEGLPDGLTVDDDGGVWLAVWGAGGVWRLDPADGAVTAVVEVPTPYTTSCAFGGEGLSTLYVTTANYQQPPGGGYLYAADLDVRGRHPHRFEGRSR